MKPDVKKQNVMAADALLTAKTDQTNDDLVEKRKREYKEQPHRNRNVLLSFSSTLAPELEVRRNSTENGNIADSNRGPEEAWHSQHVRASAPRPPEKPKGWHQRI